MENSVQNKSYQYDLIFVFAWDSDNKMAWFCGKNYSNIWELLQALFSSAPVRIKALKQNSEVAPQARCCHLSEFSQVQPLKCQTVWCPTTLLLLNWIYSSGG